MFITSPSNHASGASGRTPLTGRPLYGISQVRTPRSESLFAVMSVRVSGRWAKAFKVNIDATLVALDQKPRRDLGDESRDFKKGTALPHAGALGGEEPGNHRDHKLSLASSALSMHYDVADTGKRVWRFWTIPSRESRGDTSGLTHEALLAGVLWITGTWPRP